DRLLPEVAAAVKRLDRAVRKGRGPDAASGALAVDGIGQLAVVLDRTGQPSAATELRAAADRIGVAVAQQAIAEPVLGDHSVRAVLVEVALRASVGDRTAFELLGQVLDLASSTWTWPAPFVLGHQGAGHDLAASAGLVRAVRALLIEDSGPGLSLVPVFSPAWYGGPIEVHDAPTTHGTLSFAVRWHGQRPALLWDLRPIGDEPVELRIPGLDRAWSTTDPRGDALLAVVDPPPDLDPLRIVAEHPDIDPAMRRPGAQPAEPVQPLPDGGSFS
ncbi:MAG TPA: hypothetical protein VGM93_04790, partial [Acidimicrobiales bacterium]